MERKRKDRMISLAMKLIEREIPHMVDQVVEQLVDDWVDQCFRSALRLEAKFNGLPVEPARYLRRSSRPAPSRAGAMARPE